MTLPYTDFFMEAQAQVQAEKDAQQLNETETVNHKRSKAQWLQGYRTGRAWNTDRIITMLEQVAEEEHNRGSNLEAGLLLAIYHIKGWRK